MMYDDLISSLRICRRMNSANDNCIAFHDGSCEAEPVCMYELMDKAADAIEELTAYVRQIEELRKDGYYLQKTKMMTYGQATMTMPLPEPPEGEETE